jgi:hypothetical protein
MKLHLTTGWKQRAAWSVDFGRTVSAMHVICWLIVLAIVWLMAVSTAH